VAAKRSRTEEKDGRPLRRRRFAVALLLVVAAGAMAAAAVFGLVRLRRHVREAPMFQISAETLRLVKGPSWMTPAMLADLDLLVLDPEFPERFSLLDPGISARLAAAYERSVWVERVKRIEKHDPRVDPTRPPLEVVLTFRRPAAFVETRRGYCLVDAEGVRLPGVYREPQVGACRLLVLRGVETPPPEPGRVWSDASLLAGVKVAQTVAPQRERFRLAWIDVSNVGGRRDPRESEIALVTASGTRIRWGRAPGPEAERLEKSPAEKLAYLSYVYDQLGGRVDGVLAYIDIPNEAVCPRSSRAPRLRS